MAGSNDTHLSDLRGLTRLAFDAAAGLTDLVETVHRTVQRAGGLRGGATADRTTGITGLVYSLVRESTRAFAEGVDAGLAPLEAVVPAGESTPVRDALIAAANGVFGDTLERTNNPLALDMSLRFEGQRVDPQDPAAVLGSEGASSGKLLLLAHGSGMNDRQWLSRGHDHGRELAAELGYTPLYLRYNSGLRISRNGRELASLLETLLASWPQTVEELVIVGHSMGGLVARSAYHYAEEAGHTWPSRLTKMVFMGTPHHGAPLERGGHLVDLLMELSPYSAPFARIGKLRSAGITDLRHGSITEGEHAHVPLPEGVRCYAAAATLGSRDGVLAERLVGDGMVPLDSALGRHPDPAYVLAFPDSRRWVGYRMGHLEMLHRPEVYERLRAWLEEPS